jgi:transposase
VEQRLPALPALEQAGHLGRGARSLGECRAGGSLAPQPRQHGDPGASACGRRKRGTQKEALGRSRGGFSTKIHIRADAQGLPLVITLTGGEVHDSKAYDDLMALGEDDPDALLADKAYDSDYIRADLKDCSIKAVIPPRANRTADIRYDKKLYRLRNLIERLVNRLKQYRRIATRYEKTAGCYLSMVLLGAILIWTKFVNTT